MHFLRKNILPFLVIITVCTASYALRSEIDTYIGDMWVGGLCGHLYKACEGNPLFNILFVLTVSVVAILVCRNIYKSKGSLLRSIVCIYAILWLFSDTYWVFPNLPFLKANYTTLYLIILFVCLAFEIFSLVKNWCKGDKNENGIKDDGKGFLMDEVYEKRVDTGWKDYIDELLSLIPEERLKNESLAIGVVGNWGSGKTSFLEIMRERMEKDYRTITFNPWQCTNKDQILNLFFESFASVVKDDADTLKTTINKYRDIVLDTDIHPFVTFLARIFPLFSREATLESLRRSIEDSIAAKGSKPIAVFIDDLDRLEGDELFEVLRLIRITANFKNVVFVVAYDRRYVCKVLNQTKNIEQAEEYLQKIFHLEVSLPKFEEETLFDIFIGETSRMASLSDSQSERIGREVRRLLSKNDLKFTDFVPNFRQTRRFANVFALNFNTVVKHTKDITVSDFFGIELVHFAFPDIYQTLMYQPMTLLKLAPKAFSKADIFVYESQNDKLSDESCDKLLKSLFRSGNETPKTPKEIRSKVSYANYFSYRLPKNSLGATEFELAMTSDELDNVRSSVHSWIDKGISFESIYGHFNGYNMHDYKEIKVIRNYVCALIEFLPRLSSNGIHQIVSGRYWIRAGVDESELRNQIVPLFEYVIAKGMSLDKINVFLTSLVSAYPDDYEPDDVAEPLLDYKQRKELSEKTLSKYIEMNGKPAPCEISEKGSPFHKFIMSARYVSVIEMRSSEGVDVYANLMVEELIRQYNGLNADMDSFKEFVGPYLIKTIDPNNEIYEAKSIRLEIQSLFDGLENFEKFVKGTFENVPEVEERVRKVREVVEYAETEI